MTKLSPVAKDVRFLGHHAHRAHAVQALPLMLVRWWVPP
jgi:hypothetical protein